ncbi:hypothetical protein BVX97_00970 [bacterium E08(2017)]|nr:hypothetical protein BVX97_00970 [bacterium E08(2017)]
MGIIVRLVSSASLAWRRFVLKLRGAGIGHGTYISPTAYIDTHKPGKVIIGQNCYITRNVVILCHSDTARGGPAGIWEANGGKRVHADVEIGDNVFIGVNSVVMPGVKIGNNAIVGALSLVVEDVPEGKVVAGIPAKVKGITEDHVRGQES